MYTSTALGNSIREFYHAIKGMYNVRPTNKKTIFKNLPFFIDFKIFQITEA